MMLAALFKHLYEKLPNINKVQLSKYRHKTFIPTGISFFELFKYYNNVEILKDYLIA